MFFSHLKRKPHNCEVGVMIFIFLLSYYFCFRRNSRKLSDLSKITELLSGKTVTFFGLLPLNLVFFYTLEDLEEFL